MVERQPEREFERCSGRDKHYHAAYIPADVAESGVGSVGGIIAR